MSTGIDPTLLEDAQRQYTAHLESSLRAGLARADRERQAATGPARPRPAVRGDGA
jgi:hypothetical protein